MNQVIKIGETPLDLDSGTVISTTKRVANIGTLERQSSFTNKLNLPATAKNLTAIGMVQGSDNSTKKYIKQIGSVYANGIEIMNAAQFSFESLSDRIELLINSDNAVFFDAIKKTFLRELDMSNLDHLWSKTEMINSKLNNYLDGYIYAIHDSGYQSQFVSSLNCYGIVPSVFVKYLFNKIGETFGYTFEGDIWDTSYFEKLLMPVIDCKVGARNIEELKCRFITNIPVTLPEKFNSFIYNDFNIVENLGGGVFLDKWNVNPNGNIYYFHIPGNYKITLDYDFNLVPDDPGGDIFVGAELVIRAVQELNSIITEIGYVNIEIADQVGNFTGQLVLNVTFDSFIETTLNPNTTGSESTKARVYIDYRYGGETNENPIYFVINSLSFNIEQITNAPVSHYNRLYNIQESLPNWTCGKFIKEISNLFGIIPIVNEYDKTIRLMMFNELNANKSISKEWQSKIDLANDPVYTFKIDGYGQLNTFEYLPDSTYGYSINIENESLPKEIEYIKSEFNHSRFSRILNKSFNTIFTNNFNPEVQLDSNFTYKSMMKFNKLPRIAFLFYQDTEVIYSSFGETNVTQSTDIPFLGFEAQSFQDFNLEWQYLYERFYQSLFNGITNNILKVELEFRLSEFDIQDFDFSIPVYLENPSGYYYVQEIKDFTSSKESTSVELLRIG
jgi:hypothetical protein